jgi:hypothetical protein
MANHSSAKKAMNSLCKKYCSLLLFSFLSITSFAQKQSPGWDEAQKILSRIHRLLF